MSPRSHSVGALNPVLYPLFLLIVPHANASVVTNGKNLHTALIFGGRRQLLKKKNGFLSSTQRFGLTEIGCYLSNPLLSL